MAIPFVQWGRLQGEIARAPNPATRTAVAEQQLSEYSGSLSDRQRAVLRSVIDWNSRQPGARLAPGESVRVVVQAPGSAQGYLTAGTRVRAGQTWEEVWRSIQAVLDDFERRYGAQIGQVEAVRVF